MAAVTITTVPGYRAGPTTRPHRTATRAVYLRRRLVALLLGVALVIVMAQAGVALGGSPSQPPSAARPPSTTRSCARATRCGPWRSAWRPALTRARWSTRWRRPATASRSRRARPSSGAGRRETEPREHRSPTAARHCGSGRRGCGVGAEVEGAHMDRRAGGLPLRRCAVRSARPTTTRSSTRARPTRAPRCAAAGSAWPAAAATPPTNGWRSSRWWW